MWKKHGLLLDSKAIEQFSHSHAAIPFAFKKSTIKYDLYFASRDEFSRSRIFCVELDFISDCPRINIDTVRMVLDIGEMGSFDDSGVLPSWVLEDNGRIFLYYTGWSLGKTVPFYFHVGLACSDDDGKSFKRISRAPILERNQIDPFLTGSACVLKDNHTWKMWYVSGLKWEQTPTSLKHFYCIRQAESLNGIDWTRSSNISINFSSKDEYAIARPCVLKTPDGYSMWYSYRGDSYKLGLAKSKDGKNWERMDNQVEIHKSSDGWDSEMLEYAHVFEACGKWWMLYNGNDYGRTGLGLACSDKI